MFVKEIKLFELTQFKTKIENDLMDEIHITSNLNKLFNNKIIV